MKQEFEWEVVHEPKSLVDTALRLVELFKERAPHKTNDSAATFLRKIRLDVAVDMMTKASEAYQSNNSDHAWYFLTQASEAIGFLHASQGAVYPRADEADLRSAIRKNGSKGGKAKGENAKKIEDKIAAELCSVKQPDNGWTKATLRSQHNRLIEKLENYNDADRKWRALLKRKEIKRLLPPVKKKQVRALKKS